VVKVIKKLSKQIETRNSNWASSSVCKNGQFCFSQRGRGTENKYDK